MIVDKINQYLSTEGKPLEDALLNEVAALAKMAFLKQFGLHVERTAKTPYFSSIGKCLRQQAYDILGFEPNGKEINSRSRMVFFQGDMVEIAIIQLAKVAGCNITACGLEQESSEWEGMRGRPDGIIHNGKDFLVEAKSMSSYGFKEFEQGNIDQAYRYQLNAGMAAKGLEGAVIVALNKDAGVLGEQIVLLDPSIVLDIKARLNRLKEASEANLPERPYAPNDKGFYPWNCLYCSFWKTCLPNAERVLVKNAYKLKEKQNGNVPKATP